MAEQVGLGTFHARAARMLRRHADLVGLRSDCTILDMDDQNRVLKRRPASVLSKLSLMITRPTAMQADAPNPCSARATISNSMFGDISAAAPATVNSSGWWLLRWRQRWMP